MIPRPNRVVQLAGHTYGRLTVIGPAPRRGRRITWACRCACGQDVVVESNRLRSGHTTSCGCFQRENIGARRREHGGSNWPEYRVHQTMVNRCHNPNVAKWEYYGGRGITVCERWRGKGGFANFIADMGRRPDPDLQIERNDNDGNYEPGNCRWATRIEQAANRRPKGTALTTENATP